MKVQCGAIHHQSVVTTFFDAPQFEELPQPTRCYLVKYSNGSSKFYFSKPGVFGPDGTFATEALQEGTPRNGERYFNDAYHDDPNEFSTTLTLTNEKSADGTVFIFRQRFESWIGAFIGQIAPINDQEIEMRVPEAWMKTFKKYAPDAVPAHAVFDVMSVNELSQLVRLCFAADLFMLQATVDSERENHSSWLLEYEFTEICFLQVIDPLLKRPAEFDVEEFIDVKVGWLEESGRYLVSFPNEHEQDKMQRFFEKLNYVRKTTHGVNAGIPRLPDIYQGHDKANRKAIQDYFTSIERAFRGESHAVEIPIGANGALNTFRFASTAGWSSSESIAPAQSVRSEPHDGSHATFSRDANELTAPASPGQQDAPMNSASERPDVQRSAGITVHGRPEYPQPAGSADKSAKSLSPLSMIGLLVIVAIAGIFAFSIYSSYRKSSGIISDGPDIFHSQRVTKPSFETAIRQAFGLNGANRSVKTGIHEVTSLFVEVPFKLGKIDHRVIFLQTQKLDASNGKIEDCHVCNASISAVTYKREGKEWSSVSVRKNFASFGSWGVASIAEPVEVSYSVAPSTVAFLFAYGWAGQGYTNGGKAIFGLTDGTWSELGYIETYASNEGTCDDIIDKTEKPTWISRCWKNSGKLRFDPNETGQFSTIRVIRSGTEADNNSNVVPVKNVTYAYSAQYGYKKK